MAERKSILAQVFESLATGLWSSMADFAEKPFKVESYNRKECSLLLANDFNYNKGTIVDLTFFGKYRVLPEDEYDLKGIIGLL